ncbi:hypothetical protein V1514DRAFT_323774 [Lipomyces japonicus]|uniref:uncharacterized protein n=1 Tax=Lipomyces japonicus TaxID=56871 RepID=UPI0034CE048E
MLAPALPSAASAPSSGKPNICLCPQVTRVPRPRNAFILYRQHYHAAVVAAHPGKTNPEISKIIGEQWRQLSVHDKAVWQKLGDEEKKSHLERFPDYRYQPRRNIKKHQNQNQNGQHGNNNNNNDDDDHYLQHNTGSSSSSTPSTSPPSTHSSICAKCHGHSASTARKVAFSKSAHTHAGISPVESSTSYDTIQLSHQHHQHHSVPSLVPHLPPIRLLPEDDVDKESVITTTKTSTNNNNNNNNNVSSFRAQSQDDARQGVEALLSLGTGSTSSSEPAAQQIQPEQHALTISSIMNSADSFEHASKRPCRSSSVSSSIRSPSVSSSSSTTITTTTKSDDDDHHHKVTHRGQYWRAIRVHEKLGLIANVLSRQSHRQPRGAVIALEANPGVADRITAELVRRIEQLVVIRPGSTTSTSTSTSTGNDDDDNDVDVGHDDDDDDESTLLPTVEGRQLQRAVATHRAMTPVPTMTATGKSVLINRYVLVATNEASKDFLDHHNNHDATTSDKVAENWHWSLNTFRGAVAPDLAIVICYDEPGVVRRTLANGTRAIIVSGIEHVNVIEHEVRLAMIEMARAAN